MTNKPSSTDIPPMPKGFVDPYAPDAAARLEEAMNQEAHPVGDDELVARLRKYDWHVHVPGGSERTDLPLRAADLITDLQTRLERYSENNLRSTIIAELQAATDKMGFDLGGNDFAYCANRIVKALSDGGEG